MKQIKLEDRVYDMEKDLFFDESARNMTYALRNVRHSLINPAFVEIRFQLTSEISWELLRK